MEFPYILKVPPNLSCWNEIDTTTKQIIRRCICRRNLCNGKKKYELEAGELGYMPFPITWEAYESPEIEPIDFRADSDMDYDGDSDEWIPGRLYYI